MSELAFLDPQRPPLLRTSLGAVLRRHRLDQGRTLADVARAAKVSMPYLSEVERGRKEASSEVLAAVCAALGLELADVLTEVGRALAPARRPAAVRLDPTRLEPVRAEPRLDPARLEQARREQARRDAARRAHRIDALRRPDTLCRAA
jgi:transcriptional regulator with XRE-family HTH domain